MVLGLLKWLKDTRFYKRKKGIIIKAWTLHERKVHIKKKEEFMDFRIKEKLILRISGSKKRSFSTQEVGRKMIFP